MNTDQKKQFDALRKLSDSIEVDSLLFQAAFYQRPVHWNPDASRRYLEEIITSYRDHPRAGEAEELLAKLPSKGDSE